MAQVTLQKQNGRIVLGVDSLPKMVPGVTHFYNVDVGNVGLSYDQIRSMWDTLAQGLPVVVNGSQAPMPGVQGKVMVGTEMRGVSFKGKMAFEVTLSHPSP